MKSARLTCITAIGLLVALAIPVSLAAQEHQDHKSDRKHSSRSD